MQIHLHSHTYQMLYTSIPFTHASNVVRCHPITARAVDIWRPEVRSIPYIPIRIEHGIISERCEFSVIHMTISIVIKLCHVMLTYKNRLPGDPLKYRPLLLTEISCVPFESITQKPPETEYLPTNTALRTLLLFGTVITIVTTLTFAACIVA